MLRAYWSCMVWNFMQSHKPGQNLWLDKSCATLLPPNMSGDAKTHWLVKHRHLHTSGSKTMKIQDSTVRYVLGNFWKYGNGYVSKVCVFCTTRYIMYFAPGAKQTILHHRRYVLNFVMGHPTDILNHDDTFLFVWEDARRESRRSRISSGRYFKL